MIAQLYMGCFHKVRVVFILIQYIISNNNNVVDQVVRITDFIKTPCCDKIKLSTYQRNIELKFFFPVLIAH